MTVYHFRCHRCDDEWSFVDPESPRETCIECGSDLDVSTEVVP